MEKYGFVYVWFDRKHRRYYVGSHWGTAEDGYICSSTWMRNAYKRRPTDFKRRIVKIVPLREDLLPEEQRWLDMIDLSLGRYYNLSTQAFGHWHSKDETRQEVASRISDSMSGRTLSEEHKANIAKSAKTRKRPPRTEESRKKMSDILKGRQCAPDVSEETRKRMSQAQKKRYAKKS